MGARAQSSQDNQRRKGAEQQRLLGFFRQASHTVKGMGT